MKRTDVTSANVCHSDHLFLKTCFSNDTEIRPFLMLCGVCGFFFSSQYHLSGTTDHYCAVTGLD